MAKAPKAPGKNGASTPGTLIDVFAAQVPTLTDGHWQAEIVSATLVSVARLAGAARARALLDWLRATPSWLARGTFNIGHGLALAGDPDAGRVIEDARVLAAHREIEGQHGTHVWIDAALALHALGEEAERDRALAEALAFAQREQRYPTQPRPWLAVALARTGRVDRLIEDLGERHPQAQLSFDDSAALHIVTEQSVARGDAALFARLVAEFAAKNGYTLAEALVAGARRAPPDALVSICEVFCRVHHYAAHTIPRVAYAVAEDGQLALARRVIERTRGRFEGAEAAPDRVLEALSSPFDPFARDPHAHASLQRFRVGYQVSSRDALAYAEGREAQYRAAIAAHQPAACEQLGALGVALGSVGLVDRGTALVHAAVEGAQSLDATSRSRMLKGIALAAIEHSLGDAAFAAFKKISSKPMKAEVCKAFSGLYASEGDFIGAAMIVGQGDPRPISQLMRLSDALSTAANVEPRFRAYT